MASNPKTRTLELYLDCRPRGLSKPMLRLRNLRMRLGLPAGGIYAARGIRLRPGSEIRQPSDPSNQMMRTIRRLRAIDNFATQRSEVAATTTSVVFAICELEDQKPKRGPSCFQSFNRLKYLSDIDDRSTSPHPPASVLRTGSLNS